MLKKFALSLVMLVLPLVGQSAENFVAGKDYQVIESPVRVDDPSRIEVREFFWYGCPHCYKLEPALKSWLAVKSADVAFVRTPGAMNPVWEIAAKGFYAAESTGLVEKTHGQLFDLVHRQGRQDLITDPAKLVSFYVSQGADARNFAGLMSSFAVLGKVSKGKTLAGQYRITGVPAIIVNGKYLVDYRAGAPERMVQVASALVAKERAARRK